MDNLRYFWDNYVRYYVEEYPTRFWGTVGVAVVFLFLVIFLV